MKKKLPSIEMPTTPGRPPTPPSMQDRKASDQDLERQDFPPKYLLDRVEELAVKVYALTNENEDLTRQLKNWNSLDNVRELRTELATMTAERDAAERDKGYLSTAILQELPQELYLKVFDRYHKERGTYSQAQPTYQPEPKDRNWQRHGQSLTATYSTRR